MIIVSPYFKMIFLSNKRLETFELFEIVLNFTEFMWYLKTCLFKSYSKDLFYMWILAEKNLTSIQTEWFMNTVSVVYFQVWDHFW